jgi:hypothetical protein
VKLFNYGERAVDSSDDNEDEERGIDGEGLLPGESRRTTFTYPVEGESLIYRIGSVEFEDGTKWNAKPFKAAKAKKSKPIFVVGEDLGDRTKPRRTLTREWMTPIFEDRVLKVVEAEQITVEGVKIQTKLHLIKPERLDEVENCEPTAEETEQFYKELNNNPNFIFTEFDYDVTSFKSYEFNGKVFSYTILYELIEAEEQSDVGAGIQHIYVDEDGSGYFKLRCRESELKSLPQWIKTLAEK